MLFNAVYFTRFQYLLWDTDSRSRVCLNVLITCLFLAATLYAKERRCLETSYKVNDKMTLIMTRGE